MTLSDENGQPLKRAFYAKRIADRGVDEAIGLCRGMIADGIVKQEEAEYILRWLEANREAAKCWPCNVLAARAAEYLQDGYLDDEEAKDLFEVMSQITGDQQSVCTSTNLPAGFFDDPLPPVIFEDRAFCFTGRFAFGSRKDCEHEIENLGGESKSSISKKVDYMVIGSIGSEAWIHSSFGRKIEQAWELKREGYNLYVIPEDHWANNLI